MKFDAVVLSGGGIKGIGHCGVLRYYTEQGYYEYDRVATFAGTSIGAALCAILACGVEPMEVFRKVYLMDSFFIKPQGVNVLKDLLSEYGLMSLNGFIDIVKDIILTVLEEIPTLQELYDTTGKTLIIAATNGTTSRAEYFSRHTTPDLSILDAVKMSCNLPIIFPRIVYKNCIYFDGGLSDNIPIEKVKDAKNILASIAMSDSDTTKSTPEDLLSYIYRAIIIPVGILTKQRYQACSEMSNVTTVTTVINEPLIGLSLPSGKKMEIFWKGYSAAKFANKRQKIYFPGWTFDANSLDGWDIDF